MWVGDTQRSIKPGDLIIVPKGVHHAGTVATSGTFKAIAIKSRVHFRRGFDDSGFARTILLVEPVEPFLGTVRLDGLPYRNVELKNFYPYGDVEFPQARPS